MAGLRRRQLAISSGCTPQDDAFSDDAATAGLADEGRQLIRRRRRLPAITVMDYH